jgi:tetratricopeptide (TPR) repeat protein
MNIKLKLPVICFVFIVLVSYSLADAIDKNKNDLFNLGVKYWFNHEYLKAIEVFQQILQIDPDNVHAHYYMGMNYAALGRHRETVEALKKAKFNPDHKFNFFVHSQLGISYHELGLYGEAIEESKQAIRINPDDKTAHYYLGKSYTKLRLYKEAIEALKQAIRLDPDFAAAHYIIGLCYIDLGDRGNALEQYKTLKTLDKEMANELFDAIYR